MGNKHWILAAASGILLSIPFLIPQTGWVSLFALVPLFFAENSFSGKHHIADSLPSDSSKRKSTGGNARNQTDRKPKKARYWQIPFAAFLIWNAVSTFWIWNATPAGAVAAIILNSLQMLAIFQLFRLAKWLSSKNEGASSFQYFPYLFLTILWIGWEHIYFTWNVSWPWLTLGNSLASSVWMAQWYEFTGVEGGSLWILLSNIFIFRLIMLYKEKKGKGDLAIAVKELKKTGYAALAIVLLPVAVSLLQYASFKEDASAGKENFVVLQPNIDPYTEKFADMEQAKQNARLLGLASRAIERINQNSEYWVVAPETFIYPRGWNDIIWENMPVANENFLQLYNYTVQHSGMNMIAGACTHLKYETDPGNLSASYLPSEGKWFDSFNTAIHFGADANFSFYHKSKLVTVVESTPYPRFMKWLASKGSALAASMGGYGTQDTRTVFMNGKGKKVGCAICYESVFGDYYREYIQNGAQAMTIITNDGWWGNTPGYRQHLSYASLRAIETRRAIARSANTGISAFINQRGNIVEESEWWTEDCLAMQLPLSNRITVFVQYGDIIGRICKFLSILMLLLLAVRLVMYKKAV